jgi:dienelactone hydrolase
MKLLKKIVISSLCIGLILSMTLLTACKKEDLKSGTINFKAKDGVNITADLYIAHEKSAPFIILFHQASHSRGEYLEIGPKLNELGFNCMAVDQRSGRVAKDVINETNQDAVRLNKGISYGDALPDLEAALLYVKDELKVEDILIWGSSYSASLALILGEKYPKAVDGILAFSPGEYFRLEDKTVAEYAKGIKCPVFITSNKSEYNTWKPIYEEISSDQKTYFLPEGQGAHGSRALWETTNANQEYWEAVEDFLKGFNK